MSNRHHGHRQNRGGRRNNTRRNDGEENNQSNQDVDESSVVIQMFREFQKELDTRNDRHERIVKLSRDITIESKRLIFMLHRISGSVTKEELLQEADDKFKELYRSKFAPLATELEGQDSYQFLRAFSPGLQEYIEAVTVYYFLKQNELVGVNKIQMDISTTLKDVHDQADNSNLSATDSISEEASSQDDTTATNDATSTGREVPMPLLEYMLGIADFTGELMRMAINAVGAGDLDTPKEVTELMRVIHNAFSSFSNAPRELRRKATVLRQSLQKVENACYNLRVRGSEIPKHMLADIFHSTHSASQDDNYIGDQEEIL